MSDDRLIWFKGGLVPASEAQVSVLSPTAQFGLNVFEGIRGYWSEDAQDILLFRFQDHLDRLWKSLKLIGLSSPYSEQEILSFVRDVLKANEYREDIAVRATMFVDEEGSWSSCDPVELFVAPIPKARRDIERDSGMTACVSTWQRINDCSFPPRVKAGANYINGRYAHLEARRNGYDLPILMDRSGHVSEGAGSCLFLLRDGVLTTPSLTSSVLESITRDTLLTLAQKQGIETDVRDVDRTELYIAEEVFLCGSAAEITPLVSIDHFPIGDEQPGPITKRLHGAYIDAVADPAAGFSEWHTHVYNT